jgi:hypothetical protein
MTERRSALAKAMTAEAMAASLGSVARSRTKDWSILMVWMGNRFR